MTVNGFMSWLDCEIEELKYSKEGLSKEAMLKLNVLELVERKAHENGLYCPNPRGD